HIWVQVQLQVVVYIAVYTRLIIEQQVVHVVTEVGVQCPIVFVGFHQGIGHQRVFQFVLRFIPVHIGCLEVASDGDPVPDLVIYAHGGGKELVVVAAVLPFFVGVVERDITSGLVIAA